MGQKKGLFYLLSRYLFNEMLYPAIFCALGITIIFLANLIYELTDMIINKHVAIITVSKILIYRLPEIFVYAFPISALFATIFALGRLVKDNELTIMRISGFGIRRILVPFILLGLIISGMTYWINEEIAPWANHRSMNLLRQVIIKDVTPSIKENTFLKGPDDRQFYVRQVDRKNQTLYDVVIYEINYEGKKSPFPRVISAKKGAFYEETWELEDGIIHEFDEDGFINKEAQFTFLTIPVSDGLENFFGNQRTASEMTRSELNAEIQLFLKSGIKADSWLVDYHRKLASSFVPFIFVLIGVPLSLWNRKGWGISIVLTLVVAFGFYVVESVCRSLGSGGLMPPLLAAWLPLVIFGFLGLLLLVQEEFFIRH